MKNSLILSITIFFVCCNMSHDNEISKNENNIQKLIDSSKYVTNQNNLILFNTDSVFKSWVKDTLPNFNRWKKTEELGVLRKEIELNEDSTFIKVRSYYFMKVKKSQVINNQSQIWNVLDDLKEYSEYPDSDFEISFGHGFDYFPPEVELHRYIFTEEFESNQFTILQKDKKIIYTILRGSLREKKIISYPDSTVKIVPIYIEDRKL